MIYRALIIIGLLLMPGFTQNKFALGLLAEMQRVPELSGIELQTHFDWEPLIVFRFDKGIWTQLGGKYWRFGADSAGVTKESTGRQWHISPRLSLPLSPMGETYLLGSYHSFKISSSHNQDKNHSKWGIGGGHLLHIGESVSLYLEGSWRWVREHDLPVGSTGVLTVKKRDEWSLGLALLWFAG